MNKANNTVYSMNSLEFYVICLFNCNTFNYPHKRNRAIERERERERKGERIKRKFEYTCGAPFFSVLIV